MISSVATVQLSIQSWDFTPIIPAPANSVMILNRQATSINLPVKDYQQKQYLGVYIMSLPTKGTLYQRKPDGSLGAVIDRPFQYSFSTPSIQYASKVLNVSSFWGISSLYNPIQTLGPQNCFTCGDCTMAWCPRTVSGTGGFAKVECSDHTVFLFTHSLIVVFTELTYPISCPYISTHPISTHPINT